jgi:hypothetical protein
MPSAASSAGSWGRNEEGWQLLQVLERQGLVAPGARERALKPKDAGDFLAEGGDRPEEESS